eukprot:scaffold680219_cov34-Prasinocladus_malaysianus.AAC.1
MPSGPIHAMPGPRNLCRHIAYSLPYTNAPARARKESQMTLPGIEPPELAWHQCDTIKNMQFDAAAHSTR